MLVSRHAAGHGSRRRSSRAAEETLSGDTVTRISNPNGKPGEADGLIGDREIGYGWSMAERGDWLYIGGWRNTVGAVIKAYLEPAVLASGQMDSETMWKLVDAITNAEVPYPANENSGVLVKMNRQDPGEFQVVAETQNPFRHVAKYGNDLYFATYVGASGNAISWTKTTCLPRFTPPSRAPA